MSNPGGERARAVALGRVQRQLLQEATDGPVRVTRSGGRLADNKARHDAAAALVRLGLAETYLTSGAKVMELTAIGRELVHTFEDELRRGTRIRWAEKGWRATYAHHETEAPRVPVPANDTSPRPASRLWTVLSVAAAAILSRAA